MKAITYEEPGGPEVLELRERPDLSPGPGEVLIEVHAAGVNRADLLQRQGHYPPPPGASDILGLECSGVVRALGPDVDAAAAGDLVVGDLVVGDQVVALLSGGGYAEQVVVPAGQVLPVPDGVELVTAGGVIEVAATVVSNLDLAGLREGDTLLIHGGSGGIGSFAIPYAKSVGARVITTSGTAEKIAYCRDLGADHALSYRDDWAAEVAAISDGAGVQVIVDVMGGRYLEPNVASLATGGSLMIIGMQGGRQGTLDIGALLARRARVWATALRSRPVTEKSAICTRVRESVWPLLASGDIRPSRTTTFPLRRAAEAHALMESGENSGKIVLTTDRTG